MKDTKRIGWERNKKVFQSQIPYLYQNTLMISKRIFLGILLILMAIGLYYYTYKDHRDIAAEGAVYTDTAVALKDSIEQNNEAFLNQTVAVSGVVTIIDDNSITLNDALVAQFENRPEVQLNQQLTLKGRCIGYDDLFEVVVLDQSTLMD
jgi:S1-C subfamily serine protease